MEAPVVLKQYIIPWGIRVVLTLAVLLVPPLLAIRATTGLAASLTRKDALTNITANERSWENAGDYHTARFSLLNRLKTDVDKVWHRRPVPTGG